jgi:hypothetical protein
MRSLFLLGIGVDFIYRVDNHIINPYLMDKFALHFPQEHDPLNRTGPRLDLLRELPQFRDIW